ncbi:uncharacterized protein F5Z01DRAFT_319336 [Emericellopsis atlantica]|uniref:CFEM domain-containing protein n=1 Tax=Emericellopsis atlantica TaxID=2614577 RepID=A0A9P7ZU30_9HYPO|nr:uncharacterized protein F5Z01DRAFT_319336 [Emericellopsis atlantica]KAG9258116.1 hypothetical protein F5Z01DRAFT_319336 [Emericellopsis atlantica]
MKTAAFALSALVAVVAAQDFSDLTSCAAECGRSMLSSSKARELGCEDADIQCLCQNPDFTYGLRDCAREACSGDDQEALVSAGLKVCANVGVGITTGSEGNPTITATSTADALVTTITSDGSAWTTSTMDPSNVVGSVTSALGDITSSAGNAASSASDAASSALGSASDAVTSAVGSASDAVTSAVGSASDAVTSALGSASDAASSASDAVTSALGSASDAASSAAESANPSETGGDNEDAAMPVRTAAPAAILGAAGLAILML